MHIFFRLFSYIKYWVLSKNNNYIHSPFVFELYNHVLHGNTTKSIKFIDKYRHFLENNLEIINLEEFGAKKKGFIIEKTVKIHYKNTSIDSKYGLILYNMVQFMNSKTIVELGTSLGVSTGYLSCSNPLASVISMDAQSSTQQIVKDFFNTNNVSNTQFVLGRFEEVLDSILDKIEPIDFCFIDGNHTYEATTTNSLKIASKLSLNSVIVLDDIRWSKGMYKAWNELSKSDLFNYSIDLGRIGLLIKINNKSPKQHFILQL